jgi:hypothetical protein
MLRWCACNGKPASYLRYLQKTGLRTAYFLLKRRRYWMLCLLAAAAG